MIPISLTVYRGANNTTPIARDTVAWSEICNEVETLSNKDSHTTDKRDLMAFGPYRLQDGATRAAAAVTAMSCVVALDVDGVDVEQLQASIVRLGVSAIVHGSPSDNPEGVRKVRVYILTDAEHHPLEAGAVRDSVAALLGVTHDPRTRNADRIFFCGRLTGTPPRFYWQHEGVPLCLNQVPRVAPPEPPPAPARLAAPHQDGGGGGDAFDVATKAILTALGSWQDYDGRKHAVCGAIGGLLKGWEWPPSATEDLLREWLPKDEPSVDVDEGVRWALGADSYSGQNKIKEVLGDDLGAIVDYAAKLPRDVRRGVGSRDEWQCETGTDRRETPRGGLRFIDRSQPPPELRFIVPGLDFAPGKVNVIQGFAFTAKTPFALLLAICIASGRDFLGMGVVQMPTLYLDFEGGVLTQERDARLCAGLGLKRGEVPLHFAQADMLSTTLLEEVEAAIVANGVGAVVIDTYTSALPDDVQTFNDGGFRIWASALARVGERTGAMIVLLVHENKGANGKDGLRGIGGHGSFAGAVQAGVALSRPKESDPNLIAVSCSRSARYGFKPFAVRWSDVENADAPTGQALIATREGAATASKTKKPALPAAGEMVVDERMAGERMIEAMRGKWLPRKELIEIAGGKRGPALEALARLTKAGLLQLVAGQYTLSEAGNAAEPMAVAEALGTKAGFRL